MNGSCISKINLELDPRVLPKTSHFVWLVIAPNKGPSSYLNGICKNWVCKEKWMEYKCITTIQKEN